MGKQIVLLQTLVSTLNTVKERLANFDEALAYQRPDATTWSVADVVQHFSYVEQGLLKRLHRIVEENNPYLPYLHPNEDAHTSNSPLADLLAEFETHRNNTISYLNGLSLEDWEKTAVHETEGAAKLPFFVQMIIDHDRDHLSQLIGIQQKLQKEAV
ncbi:MAG: DinB family protein [Chloroflexota bacterium]